MIRVKVVIVDSRASYLRKLLDAFASDYADRVEPFAFSSLEGAEEYFKSSSADIMLVESALASDSLAGKKGAVLAYLTDDASVETVYGHRAICRFQKTELIYKSIVDACSEKFDHVSSKSSLIEQVRVFTFFPASGGAGASTMAASCALAAAKRGLRAFYLNLELTGTSKAYFDAPGEGGLEDVLFAIGAKKSNVVVRLQALVKSSPHGVRFLDSCDNALDTFDVAPEQLEQLVRDIAASDAYDVIVLDMDFGFSPLALAAMRLSRLSVFVSNGTPVSNGKFERAYRMLQQLEQRGDAEGCARVVLAYNNFNSKFGVRLDDGVVPVVGGMGRVVRDAQRTPLEPSLLIEALSSQPLFGELLAVGS